MLALLFSVAPTLPACAATPDSEPTTMPIDPAFTSPFPDEPAIDVLADGYRFTEGPAVAPDGSVYFSDIPNNAIHRYDPATGNTAVFSDDSGGSNGLLFLPDGRLLVCEDRDTRQVWFWRLTGDAEGGYAREAVVPGKFNGPNDAAVHPSGGFAFFTDPLYGRRENPVGFEGVYRVNLRIATRSIPAQHPVQPVIKDLVRPNGIGISPDGDTLYVNDNGAKLVMAYPIDDAGELGEGRLFHNLDDLGGPDGMCVDAHGRVYVAIYDRGILVLSPDGEQRLAFLPTGPQTTNCTLSTDGKTLYVTAEKSLKRVRLED